MYKRFCFEAGKGKLKKLITRNLAVLVRGYKL